jgi:hypothetical protein
MKKTVLAVTALSVCFAASALPAMAATKHKTPEQTCEALAKKHKVPEDKHEAYMKTCIEKHTAKHHATHHKAAPAETPAAPAGEAPAAPAK